MPGVLTSNRTEWNKYMVLRLFGYYQQTVSAGARRINDEEAKEIVIGSLLAKYPRVTTNNFGEIGFHIYYESDPFNAVSHSCSGKRTDILRIF